MKAKDPSHSPKIELRLVLKICEEKLMNKKKVELPLFILYGAIPTLGPRLNLCFSCFNTHDYFLKIKE